MEFVIRSTKPDTFYWKSIRLINYISIQPAPLPPIIPEQGYW